MVASNGLRKKRGFLKDTSSSLKVVFRGELELLVCGATGCRSRDSLRLVEQLKKEIQRKKHLLEHKGISIVVKQTGCHGFCQMGPTLIIMPLGIFYVQLKPEDAEQIISSILNSYVLEDKIFREGSHLYPFFNQIPFFKYQQRVLLEECGFIDPLNVDEFIRRGGFKGLRNAVELGPEKTLEIIKEAKLRGRGGAGFPTYLKWKFLKEKDVSCSYLIERSNPRKRKGVKYIICNADEGDPGAFMDRGLIESNPLLLIEGMLICAYVTGATKGIIYVRREYPLAESILRELLPKLYERGFLGKNVFHLGFDFDIEVRSGAGAFVCGEETALIKSLEGKRGMPRPRPPYPAEKGLFGCPTNINNVKTFCSAALILRHGTQGAEWFLNLATPEERKKSGGTILLALSGKVKYTGLVEIGLGKKLSYVIDKIGGGSSTSYPIKAVQTGGPSGGCLPYNYYFSPDDKKIRGFKNLKLGYESLQKAGSILGSGGMIVLDESDSIVELVAFFLDFLSSESCGQCTPCREGLKQMKFIMQQLLKGEAGMSDIKKLEELAYYIKENSLCGLGQTGANPVLSSLRYFKKEYLQLLEKEAFLYEISDRCIGCHKCAVVCPVEAIKGEINSKHYIDQSKCIKCGSCYRSCPVKAIDRLPLKKIE